MSFPRSLLSLGLLAFMALPALAQNQPSQPSSSQSQASQPAQTTEASKGQTAQTQTPPPATDTSSAGTTNGAASSSTTGTTPPSAPAPSQNPGPTTTPAPQTDSSTSAPSNAAPGGQQPVQEPDASKVKHDGGEDDVDAIGNRKIGQRGLGDWYSLETEIKMGKQYSMQVENSVKLVQDPVVNEYVNRIGQNLVRNSDAKGAFTIKVMSSAEVNAFALPGGFFYVNSGLILAADEEAEL